jgi:Xaa-Pro aminopeptidase
VVTLQQPLVDPVGAPQLLREAGLDAVIATSPRHVVLLSGYGTWLEEKLRGWMLDPAVSNYHVAGFAVLDSSVRAGLVASPLFAEEAGAAWASTVVTPDRPAAPTGREAADALLTLIGQMGLADARLGVELDGAPPWLRTHLADALPRTALRDCSVLLRLCRMRKSPEALRRMRQVALVTERALEEALDGAPPPLSLASRFRQALARSCADFDHLVYGLPSGHGLSLGGSLDAWPDASSYLDVGARLAHFYSDTGLTLDGAGEPSPRQMNRFTRAREALLAGASALSSGARCSTVYRAMAIVANSDPALRVQGHGLGLDIRELPLIGPVRTADTVSDETITASADVQLETGMVVNLEVSGFYEDGSVQLEETFAIAPGGGSLVGPRSRDAPWRLF